ncbi:MAG: alpha/beta hydrolase fold domain-containing protein [Pseudonocardiaceae bacterium]
MPTRTARAAHVSRAAAAPVFLLAYRLAPEHPYPAALMDTLAAYASRDAMLHPGWPAVAADEYRASREATTPQNLTPVRRADQVATDGYPGCRERLDRQRRGSGR